HHAGIDDFWGFCYFNDVALSISNLRLKFNPNLKFSILDTDSHHGDGTRDVFKFDEYVQHVCFCSSNETSTDELKVDIPVPSTISDEDYVKLVEENYFQRLRNFKPDMVFWHFGYDTYKEDYGSRGLTEKCFLDLTKKVKNVVDEVCRGKLVVVLCGGSGKRFAKNVFPRLIKILAEIEG
ncbi:MAG: histone deacetylase, partial [Candidatus Bathyarchaeota archaeon]|nr:histone deacetylase [Candidatus Bathyarchaeota archaeon]